MINEDIDSSAVVHFVKLCVPLTMFQRVEQQIRWDHAYYLYHILKKTCCGKNRSHKLRVAILALKTLSREKVTFLSFLFFYIIEIFVNNLI
jgi:hypothetical protein